MKKVRPAVQIITVSKLLRKAGFICATEGNLSLKKDELIFITPSGFDKATISEGEVVIVDLGGKKISGGDPSSELFLHLEIYRIRKDVCGIIHAHPPIATSLTLLGHDLSKAVLPEIILSLGKIPMAKYATPGSLDLARRVAELAKKHDAILLERHGAVAVGKDLICAYWNMERLEYAAKVIYNAMLLGNVKELSKKELKKLTHKICNT